MKISQLANKFNITTNTIRYYMETGLLIPASKDKQYRFNEQNIRDLEHIAQLKEYHFSINDIHKILSLIRISNLVSKEDVRDYLDILENQKCHLLREESKLKESISSLEKEIIMLRHKITTTRKKSGVPIIFLSYLYCPKCNIPLTLEEALIKDNQIFNGKLSCSCNYRASIDDGIIIVEEKNISKYDYPDLERKFYKDMPAPLVTLFQKSYNWMSQCLKKMDLKGKIILEDHINAYFYLYTNFSILDKNALYIVADKYPEIVCLYKKLIDYLDLDLNILYLADSTLHYPLKKNIVDIFIDFFSSNEYAIFNQGHLIKKLENYFHQDASFIGTYFSFNPGSKSMKNLCHEYPETWEHNFNQPFYKKYLLSKYQLIEDNDIGYVTDSGINQSFTFHEKGERLNLYSSHFKSK